MRSGIGFVPDQGGFIEFWEPLCKILDFFKAGEKEKIMLEHPETLVNPAFKEFFEITIVPGSEVSLDVFLLATAENPFFADEIGRICNDAIIGIIWQFG